MSQGKGVLVSLGAMTSSLASLACCFPLGAAAALGFAGAGAFANALRPWFLGIAVALLGFGFWQQRRARQCGLRPSTLSVSLLWIAVAVVAVMVLFPQEVAGFLTDRFLTGAKP
jgi:hypothetical protein